MPGLFHGTPLERPVTCEYCANPADHCACPKDPQGNPAPPSTQHPRVRREKRRGKWTTIIAELNLAEPELKTLTKQLKQHLSAGGGLTNNEIIIQGDHKDQTITHLKSLGYHPKPAGG